MSLKQQLIDSNPAWKELIERWQFLIDSYMGGYNYKEGEYLTSYMFENREQYESRLDTTPLDNHVKAVVAIYNSFLFRQPPKREMGSLDTDVTLEPFMQDADLEGRSFDAVMRDVSTYSSIYGHTWVIIDKPDTVAFTRAEELEQGIRPYISIYTPENVLDWNYSRAANGVYYLDYLKIYEGKNNKADTFRIYTPETITVIEMGDKEDPRIVSEIPNALGMIPAVCVYSQRSPMRGVGVSDVGDVADMQRAIYNELSELEQLIRISNHPSLVKTAGTQASAGAGSIVQMPDDLPEGLKPFLLEPNGSGIEGILESIKNKIEAIDRMSHMGGIRSIESRRLSGVALATEFQLLNARLAEKADNLEHAEEQIWRIYARWQDVIWDGMIDYPNSFNIQDKYNDMNMLKLAKEAGIVNPVLNQEVERQMLRILVEDDDKFMELENKLEQTPMAMQDTVMQDPETAPLSTVMGNDLVHDPVGSAEDLVMHMMEMTREGYTMSQILELHPELRTLFNE